MKGNTNKMPRKKPMSKRSVKKNRDDKPTPTTKPSSAFGVWHVPVNVRIVDNGRIDGGRQ